MARIPVFDLQRAVQPLAGAIENSWRSLLADTAFVGGEEVQRFERSFAEFLGSGHCVAVANGTDALQLALRTLDLRPGDEVIVPSFTFIATAAAVVLAGGRPVFADVEQETLNLAVESVEAQITGRTVGVIGVHLYGRPFDVDALGELCRRRGLWLVEDAAQAHGAEWRGTKVGNFGHLASWSFYPSKNLGCFGDGGAVTGNDPELLARVRRLANHGRLEHYLHAEAGTNSRLDALQAAVLNRRLPQLASDNRRRRRIADLYRGGLAEIEDIQLLADPAHGRCVYHQVTILTSDRRELRQALERAEIGTSVHYPLALHLQPAFRGSLESAVELPVAAAAGDRVLCLPMYPQLSDDEVHRVCGAVRRFYGVD